MINLSYLRYFYLCAQSGTFTKAALRLNISQPSLSMQIKNFEEQLGFPLFIRSGKELQLTPRGQGLFLYASKIFEVTDEMDKYLLKQKTHSHHGNTLRIGVTDEVERPFVADLLGRMIRANSSRSFTPSILSKKHDEMVSLVADEEIDVVLTGQKTHQLKLIGEFQIPVMVVSANLGLWPQNQALSLQNIFKMLGQDLILPTEEMILAKETRTFMKQQKLEVPTILTSNILACIIRATQEKLGAAFLPVAYVNRELQNGTLRAFGPKDGFWQHHLYLYTYKGNANTHASSLAKILKDLSVLKFGSQGITLAP